ncbi:MAG: AraC family transcriptional regulator [Devosia sp.]|nr:AraC family transcriptional regulator [Devosia sp.]
MSLALRHAVERKFSPDAGDFAFETEISGLGLMRATGSAVPRKARLYRPSLCLVVQGAKEMALGERVFRYGEMQALVVSLEVPAAGRVIEASAARPYLAISLELDAGLIAEMLGELDLRPAADSGTSLGLFVADVDGALADAFERVLRLLDTPAAIPALGRQTLREIYYWLLTGPHGPEIARLTSPEGHAQRIGRALRLLRENFAQPLRVPDLARAANMSSSSFHQHFKALTNLSPLQYQKQLRLIEARRLIVADDTGVASAAYRVGYESPSQFSREYARMFGLPPRRHSSELRGGSV